jgi:hypothetical protein
MVVSDADHVCFGLSEIEYSSGKRHFSNSWPPAQLFFYEEYPIIEPWPVEMPRSARADTLTAAHSLP